MFNHNHTDKKHHDCERFHSWLVEDVEQIGVFTLVTRGWAASEFLTRVSKFNVTPNGVF